MTELHVWLGGALLATLVGFVLGTLFFLGLHRTVTFALGSRAPAVWFLASLVVRTSLVLAGFLLVAGHRWERWLSCLLGFVMARWTVTKVTSRAGKAEHATQPR